MNRKTEPENKHDNSKSALSDLLGTCTWSEQSRCEGEDTLFTLHIAGDHRLSVLDRLTGFSGGIRDIESGYSAPDGNFWLASGDFDIREFQDITVEEAIGKVKECANTCRGA